MKSKFGIFSAVFALVALSTMMVAQSTFAAEAVKEGKAEVRGVRGSAKYRAAAGEEWKTIKVGMVLKTGATIQTGPESNVDLYLGKNGPVVRVVQNSTLLLEKLTFMDTGADTVINTQLNLSSGRILGYVQKLAPASTYEVKTPTGIAGIRGTEYDISADGTITVKTGTVIIAYIDPNQGVIKSEVIHAGQTFKPGGPVKPADPNVLKLVFDQLPRILATPVNPAETPVFVVEERTYVSGTTGSDGQ